jgi:Anti-sigma-K factor rskA/Sigma-70, region 4
VGTTRPLDRLSPESRAVLSLVLLQSRSYADIAALLHLDEADVRRRAHTAAVHLVASDERPSADAQVRIIDFVLGEQTVSERSNTRALLEHDSVARAWAIQLVDGLAPLERGQLPEIPRDAPKQPETPQAERRTPDTAPPATATAPEPPPRVIAAARAPIDAQPQRSPSIWKIFLPLGILLVAAVIVVLSVSSGGNSKPSSGMASQLVLRSTTADPGARGSATVMHQHDGFLLQLRARGLAPNTRNDSYAVWLYNSQSEALLLGFVSPPVGRSGSFANGVTLPADADRFHAVIVTVETVSQPSTPGKILLQGPLSLS